MGERGPILAVLAMGLTWALTRNQGLWIFTLIILALVGIGYQFSEKIPLHYKIIENTSSIYQFRKPNYKLP